MSSCNPNILNIIVFSREPAETTEKSFPCVVCTLDTGSPRGDTRTPPSLSWGTLLRRSSSLWPPPQSPPARHGTRPQLCQSYSAHTASACIETRTLQSTWIILKSVPNYKRNNTHLGKDTYLLLTVTEHWRAALHGRTKPEWSFRNSWLDYKWNDWLEMFVHSEAKLYNPEFPCCKRNELISQL